MKKVTVILAHPYFSKSNANAIIVNSLKELENVNLRHIDSIYPNGKIDIEAEQKILSESDMIIFQFPTFWYNVPASLKNWIDNVLAYGFAFGANGDKLKGKEFLVSTTIGGPEAGYSSGNVTIEELFVNLKTLGNFTGMKNLPMVKSYGMAFIPGINEDLEAVQQNAKAQAETLIKLINNSK